MIAAVGYEPKKIGKNDAPYLYDGSGCEKCNFTGNFGGWINGHWHSYPMIKCDACEPTPAVGVVA